MQLLYSDCKIVCSRHLPIIFHTSRSPSFTSLSTCSYIRIAATAEPEPGNTFRLSFPAAHGGVNRQDPSLSQQHAIRDMSYLTQHPIVRRDVRETRKRRCRFLGGRLVWDGSICGVGRGACGEYGGKLDMLSMFWSGM